MAKAADTVITRGEGSYLYAAGGTRLLDAVSGYGVASLGHSHPRWVEAVTKQAGRLAVTSLYTDELARYLEKLSGVLPAKLAAVVLASTGAEAVEIAIRLAQTSSSRPAILTFTDGFHGKTAAVRYTQDPTTSEAESFAPQWLRSASYPVCTEHDAVDYAVCHESVEADIAALESRRDLNEVAAVLVEPVLGTAGNVPPKRGLLAALRDLCRRRGWLLVLDESITGFGRTSDLFAFESFGVEPDILVLSKGLGGGFPLSAVCASHDLWNGSAFAAASATSSSYGGNPIACAAGAITLDIITEPAFLAHVRHTSAHAARRLRELATASPYVTRPRGLGFMLGFDLVDPQTDLLADAARCHEVFHGCRDRGVLVAANVPRVRINPPLTITVAEIDLLFEVLADVLA